MVGYSGTPLARKLGISAGARVLTINPPSDLRSWLEPVPEGVIMSARIRSADVVLVFCRDSHDLRALLPRATRAIGPEGVVWVGWPKKSSGMASDLQQRDTMMSIMLPTGLVDVKVGAISDIWSGLKFVVRKTERGGWAPGGAQPEG